MDASASELSRKSIYSSYIRVPVRGSAANSPSDKEGEGSQTDLGEIGGDSINVVVR